MKRYDIIVIGAGPAGYPCAIRLGQLKKKVLVIEEKELGGVCLNQGCIPTKALSFAAEMVDNFKKAKRMGFKIENPGFDLDILKNWKDGVVKRLRSGIEYLLKNNGVEYKQGRARIVSEHQVQYKPHTNSSSLMARAYSAGLGQGEDKTGSDLEYFEAENIVIATGTEVISLPGLDFDSRYIINTDDALGLKEIPKNLLVIGAGASGLEMATIYQRLGSKVTVVEIMEQILPGMETELCDNLYKILKRSGIEIYLSSQVTDFEKCDDKLLVSIKKLNSEKDAALRQKAEIKESFDKVLVTVGRKPTDSAFKDLHLAQDEKGYLIIDEQCRTSIQNIFAIGDIVGPPLLAHKATKQGVVVAEIIAGLKRTLAPYTIPSAVFTIPPFSSVGLTEKEARSKNYKVKIGRFPYRASGKALSMEETEGLVKVVGDEEGRLLGLHILGAESPSLIAEGILGVAKGLTVADLTEIIHPHPTLTEIIAEAADNFYKKAIHVIN